MPELLHTMIQRDHSYGWTHDRRMVHVQDGHTAEFLDDGQFEIYEDPADPRITAMTIERKLRAWHRKIHGAPKNTPAARRAAAKIWEMGGARLT